MKSKKFLYSLFLLVLGFIFCFWIGYNRLFRIRIPRNLEIEISFVFFIIACISFIIFLFLLKEYFFPKIKESWVTKFKLFVYFKETKEKIHKISN